jgi:uncharacterized tellurite resistance protein B-like protein
MSFMHRLFGGSDAPPAAAPAAPAAPVAPAASAPSTPQGDTATVRRIVGQLEALPPDRARLLAGAAYVVSRAANADMEITADEVALMEQMLVERLDVSEAEAVIVVEIARQQAFLFGSTEDYLVTREFKRVSTPEQRLGVLRACFQVAAANDEISSPESAVLNQIATELDIDPTDFDAVRTEHRDQLSVVRAMRAVQAG